MKSLIENNLLERHINFEKEHIHVLTALYGATCQSKQKVHLEIAKSIELMKAAALIIDDFLDKSPKRNGIPSIYFERGSEEAVLTGEILKSSSLIAFVNNLNLLENVSFDKKINAIKLFEKTYKTICLGQLKDIELQKKKIGDNFSEEEYFEMIKKTSAVFVQFPVVLGATLSDFNEKELLNLSEFGIKIGLAYQLRDDVLDVIGDQDYTGKIYSSDIRERKKRILLIHSLKNGSKDDTARLETIYNKKDEITFNEVNEIINIFKRTGSIDYCILLIKKYCDGAIAHLSYVNNKKVVEQLKDIACLLTRFDDLPKNKD